jgi:hypothetical protein
MSDMGLLDAQASGGIDGANAYMQAQQELARRKKMAADQALAEAQGRGAPQVAVDQSVAAAGAPYESADRNMIQQSADYTADMGRRQGRWNEYAHNVESARTLVGSQAQGRASVIDADTKAKLALMEAQARASSRASGGGGRGGGGGGGGGGDTKKPSKPTVTELKSALGAQAVENLKGRAVQADEDYSETRRFANQSRNNADANMVKRPQANKFDLFPQRAQQLAAQQNNNSITLRQAGLRQAAAESGARRYGPMNMDKPEAAQEDLRQYQQIANRLDAQRVPVPKPTIAPAQKKLDDESGYTKARAARDALERQINQGLTNAGMLRDNTIATALYDGNEVRNEMGRVAESQLAELAALGVDQYDLAAALQPQVDFGDGESVAQLDDRLSGGESRREGQNAADEAELAQRSSELGVDLASLTSQAKFANWRQTESYLTSAQFQQAIDAASQAEVALMDDPVLAQRAVDEDKDYETLAAAQWKRQLKTIKQSLPDAASRALFDAYVGWSGM